MPTNVLAGIQTKLLNLMAPLTKANGGPLASIIVETIATPQDVRAALQSAGANTLPIGILSMGGFGAGTGTDGKAVNLAAQARVNWTYAFAMAFSDLDKPVDKFANIYEACEIFMANMADRDLNKEEAAPGWTLYRVDIASSTPFRLDDQQLYGVIWTFVVQSHRKVIPQI